MYDDPKMVQFIVGPGLVWTDDYKAIEPTREVVDAINRKANRDEAVSKDTGLACFVDEEFSDVIDGIWYNRCVVKNHEVYMIFTANICPEKEDLMDTIDHVMYVLAEQVSEYWSDVFESRPVLVSNGIKVHYTPYIPGESIVDVLE